MTVPDIPVLISTDVIVADDRKPVLFDARERPLAHPMGFRYQKEGK